MSKFWMDLACEEDVMIVDLGYADEQSSWDKAVRLKNSGIGKRNFRIEPINRLCVSVPKTKRAKVLNEFSITNEIKYFGTTHFMSE